MARFEVELNRGTFPQSNGPPALAVASAIHPKRWDGYVEKPNNVRAFLALLLASSTALVALTVGAEAQTPQGTFSVTPASGPAGSVVSATSMTQCPRMDGPNVPVPSGGKPEVVITVSSSTAAFADEVVLPIPTSGGAWQGQITLRPDFPAGPASVSAACVLEVASDVRYRVLDYAAVSFVVTASSPPASQAPVVQARPSFTG